MRPIEKVFKKTVKTDEEAHVFCSVVANFISTCIKFELADYHEMVRMLNEDDV
jgi:hypothetical protein